MSDKRTPVEPLSKHKRARRKKYQEDKYKNKEELMQQLGRRFHNQPSTSAVSPTSVQEIPLPSEVQTPLGDAPRLTERDYDRDYLKDPKVVSSFSGALVRSTRYVVKAEEAEVYMMGRARTSPGNVLSDFRSRVLNVVKAKRKQQVDVPYVEFPCHSLENKQPIREKVKKETNENDTSSSDSSHSSDSRSGSSESEDNDEEEGAEESGSGAGRSKKRREQRKIALEKKKEEKDKLSALLKMAVERKKTHPNRLHADISYNESNIGNDGPECRCPPSIQNNGLKHGYYAGENKVVDCTRTGGANLHYYTLRVLPAPNDAQIFKTQLQINGDTYTFEGFSLVTHAPLPICMTRRPICMYAMDYEFQLVEEDVPDGCFAPEDCDDLSEYIFHEIFEMVNFQLRPKHVPAGIATCPMIHIMPRFECFKDGVVNLWSSKTVLAYFLSKGGSALFDAEEVDSHCRLDDDDFGRCTGRLKQSIVLNTKFKPSAVRADWFERDAEKREVYFVHNAIRSSSYPTGIAAQIAKLEKKLNKLKSDKRNNCGVLNPEYEAVKLEMDKLKEEARAARILRLRESVTGYIDTGLKPDAVAHIAMTIVACHHIRYNFSISVFEEVIEYQFNDRRVIELAFIHSSFRTSYGTPIDHVKNIVNNCGYRRKYGAEEKREKKKVSGIVSLFTIMGGEADGEPILHNERLEYLGDAVVELIASHHLFFMLPHHFEGGLATYRTALVQNRNLANLAKNCRMDEMLQFAHGADLINEADFKHALANSFEAVMAAVYLDGGLGPCDAIFSKAMYGSDPELKRIWDHHNEHELKREDPLGDRDLSKITPVLASFHELERRLGIQFNNIRLLAKAFTRRNVPNNDLTKGHNQRLEWLGDSVLQLLISDFLYKNFPNHHEGHMSLLRTSLVSNQTQSVVCDNLGFLDFVIKPPHKVPELKVKDKADIVEAFIGALYVDSGIEHCRTFVRIVFCPRLRHFIESEQWNDAKSHLQQWCLAMKKSRSELPAMPEYRVLGIEGPTNNRVFRVAVYFRGERLATGASSNVHKAELKAAETALADLESSSVLKDYATNISRKHRRLRRIFFG